jgi:hypothetical protein
MVAKKKTEEPEELKLKASGDAVHGRYRDSNRSSARID